MHTLGNSGIIDSPVKGLDPTVALRVQGAKEVRPPAGARHSDGRRPYSFPPALREQARGECLPFGTPLFPARPAANGSQCLGQDILLQDTPSVLITRAGEIYMQHHPRWVTSSREHLIPCTPPILLSLAPAPASLSHHPTTEGPP